MPAITAIPAAPWRGSALLLVALALFTVEITVIKLLAANHGTMQLALWRAAAQLVLLAPVFLMSQGRVLASTLWRLHLLRGVLSAIGLWTFFYAFSALPLAFATAISFTQPLFLVLLAVVALGERPGTRRLGAAALGFTGALVAIRPGAVPIETATIVALLGALSGAALLTVTKRLSATDGTMTIMAWVAVSTTAAFLVPGLLAWTPPTDDELWLFALLSIAGPVGQFLLINAFRMADASALAPLDFAKLIMAGIAGFAVFGEVPDLWTVLGSALIVGSTLLAAPSRRGA